MQGNGKNKTVDILKGIGICFVVYGHLIPGTRFLFMYFFSFHMPLFFFLSGYCYTEKLAKRNTIDYITDRFFKLLIPGWIYVNLFHLIRIGWNEYFYNIRQRITCYMVPMDEWFLPTSFLAGVLLLLAVKLRENILANRSILLKKTLMIALFIAAVYFGIFFPMKYPGVYENINRFSFFRVENALVGFSFMNLGFMLRNDFPDVNFYYINIKRIIIIAIIGLFSIYFIRNTGYINLCDRSYGSSVVLFYFFALFGIGTWAIVSSIVCKYTRFLGKYLSFLGENSLYIYILQGLIIISQPYILGRGFNSVAQRTGIWTWEEIGGHFPKVPAIIYFVFIILCSSLFCLLKQKVNNRIKNAWGKAISQNRGK